MSVFERLAANRSTVSSALGKALAREVLRDDRTDILSECVHLTCYDAGSPASRNSRAGAARVVEIVAEERPELVAPDLGKLFPALAVEEPQTRWMVIRVMGFCARLNALVAREAVAYAERYLADKKGLVLASSADPFLGDLGAVSRDDAHRVFPILEKSLANPLFNEPDWIPKALAKVLPNLDQAERARAVRLAEPWGHAPRKATQHRAQEILRLA